MNLTDRDKQIIKDYIDRGEPLPPKYKVMLFADAPEVELIWQGKTTEITSVVLPFQSIEQIDEPRAENLSGKTLDLFATDAASGRQSGGWTNKLIWGDNKLVLSSLKNGPMRREIEAAGGLKLIYIDPPFDVGADFSVNIEIGEGERLTKEPSDVEELAYRDTWGRGTDSYIAMVYERIKLMRNLLAADGSLFVHCDWRVNSHIRLILSEAFGSECFCNEIVWKRTSAHSDPGRYGNSHDSIYWYSRESGNYLWNQLYGKYDESYIKSHYRLTDEKGRCYRTDNLTATGLSGGGYNYEWNGVQKIWRLPKEKMQELHDAGRIKYTNTGTAEYIRYLDEMPGAPLQDVWDDIFPVNSQAGERLHYSTQKPEALLERIIKASSNEGDLFADFFCVAAGTRILTPIPLSKDGEGAQSSSSPSPPSSPSPSPPSSPSPSLGKGSGDGDTPSLGKGSGDGDSSTKGMAGGKSLLLSGHSLTPIESIRPGDLVLTHRNRFMPVLEVMQREHVGEILEISFRGCTSRLLITPEHPVAVPAPPLPEFEAKISTARKLRKDPTPAEANLWTFLRGAQTGAKFRRQFPMGPFILDFYAPGVRLAIEVDGSIHDLPDRQEYDTFRQQLIEQFEIAFLRFDNKQVESDMAGLLVEVKETVRERSLKFDHRVCWLPAADLRAGMTVLANGAMEERVVTEIRSSFSIATVYNLRVDGDNSYVTEGCAVHNCGSGTTLAVAEKLGRKWIGCDLGRFAIHTTRKRLIGVQRELKAKGHPYRSFEILNLGKYERQYFAGINPNLPEEERTKQAIQKEDEYLSLILAAYKTERLSQLPPFHGKKSATAVVVGPLDSPVTLAQVNEIIDECCRKQISKVDVLGFEFEMGLKPVVQDEARQKGVSLSLKYIPKDVFDKRAVERGQVQFYDVAYVEVLPKVKKNSVVVTLTDFGVFYRQDDLNTLGEKLKPGGSKVSVDEGQVVKIVKDKKRKITREVLTKKWTDWIDYWAVDFDYENRPEVIRVVEDGKEREVWTGNYIFENEWQSYRTRKDRNLELTSGKRAYEKTGRYKIAVKVIDIFGNDTTKVVEVKV